MPLRRGKTARPPATRELALKTARRLNLPPISQWPKAKPPCVVKAGEAPPKEDTGTER